MPQHPDDTKFGLQLARHLWEIQSEDGCDEIGQKTYDLAWSVMRRFGLRFKMVQHEPAPDCPKSGPHPASECEHDGVALELEPTSGADGGADA